MLWTASCTACSKSTSLEVKNARKSSFRVTNVSLFPAATTVKTGPYYKNKHTIILLKLSFIIYILYKWLNLIKMQIKWKKYMYKNRKLNASIQWPSPPMNLKRLESTFLCDFLPWQKQLLNFIEQLSIQQTSHYRPCFQRTGTAVPRTKSVSKRATVCSFCPSCIN